MDFFKACTFIREEEKELDRGECFHFQQTVLGDSSAMLIPLFQEFNSRL